MKDTTVIGSLSGMDQWEDQQSSAGSNWLLTVCVILILFLVGLFVTDRLFHPDKFQIKEIVIRGEFKQVDSRSVEQEVRNAVTGNYFSVALGHLETQITELPWVFSASLRRQWPATIVVEVDEVQPIARWKQDRWMNYTGDLVPRESHRPGLNVETYADLPLLSGPDSQSQTVWKAFRHWAEKFALSGLSLDALELDPRGLWKIELSLGALANTRRTAQPADTPSVSQPSVVMVVDRENARSRIERFLDTLNNRLLDSFSRMATIDLRYPNGFAIAWRQDAGQPVPGSDNQISYARSISQDPMRQ